MISRKLENAELILEGDFVLTLLGVLPLPPSTVGQKPIDLILDETGGVVIEIRRWYKADEVGIPDVSGGLAVA
tara:strand:- start:445 stop:663 length:219 start_codon:yes stop_codon:yes gene_type:complete